MRKQQNLPKYIHNSQVYGRRCQKKILRTLLQTKCREYKCCFESRFNGDVVYDGNIYLSNYRFWFGGCFRTNKPHFIKTNISRQKNQIPKWRIKDSIVYQSPAINLNDADGLHCGCYAESLYVLTSSSYLVRYTINEDQFNEGESVYLGCKFKFEQLSYDRIYDRLIIKSQSLSCVSDIAYYFAIFDAAPLQFVGVLPVSKTKFGAVVNSFIFNGMLTILTSHKIYSLYDLQYILDNFVRKYKIGDILSLNETKLAYGSEATKAVVGCYPCGLPINVDMEESHHDYHVYSCCAENLDFGGFPWQSLLSYSQNTSDTCIYDMRSGKLLVNVRDRNASNNLDEKLAFHADKSGRLLKRNHNSIFCYKIADLQHPVNPDDNLNICFHISFSEIRCTPRRQSRFGRKVTQNLPTETSLKSEVIHSVDYDEDLDLIVILYTDVGGGDRDGDNLSCDVYRVGMYDNQTGDVLRVLTLDEQTVSENDDHDWTIYFSDLVLTCVLKSVSCKSRTLCYMYQLTDKDFISRKGNVNFS